MSRCVAMVMFVTACAGSAPHQGGGNNGGGENGGGDNGGGTSISAADFVAKLGKLDCDEAFSCKASFPTDAGVTFEQAFGATAQDCYTQAAMYNMPAQVQAEIDAGKIHYDGMAAAACVAGITYPDCATYWMNGGNYPDACAMAIMGTVADGGACVVDFDCSNTASICDSTTHKCGPDPMQRTEAPRLFDIVHAMY